MKSSNSSVGMVFNLLEKKRIKLLRSRNTWYFFNFLKEEEEEEEVRSGDLHSVRVRQIMMLR